jgi:hypothetical protein
MGDSGIVRTQQGRLPSGISRRLIGPLLAKDLISSSQVRGYYLVKGGLRGVVI